MRRNTLAVLAVLGALLLPQAVLAQNTVPFAPIAGVPVPAPKPPTLAEALMQAEQPKQDVYLTVGADTVLPPKPDGAEGPPPALPPSGASIAQVADAYGRLIYGFETVTAIAPPTMTLLNTSPGTPEPFNDIPKEDAFKLLLGSLSTGQWAALTSSRGLGITDLADETQRGLFAALFPPKGVTLHVRHDWDFGGAAAEDNPIRLTEMDMTQVRLRLGQQIMIGLPVVGKDEWLDAPDTPPSGQTRYQIYGGEGERSKDTLYGVKIKGTMPNAPKDGQLDFSLPALKQVVSLTGVKTVGDLISRIGQITHIELYADRRYEKRSVTVLGARSAQVRDVLRALALCVTGTYRQVGPAFVLTDDILGSGTRHMILSRFSQTADLMRHSVVNDAGDKLVIAHGSVDDLPMGATDLGFSDAQKQLAAKDSQFHMPGQGMSIQIPMAQLTPAQQQAARQFTDKWNQRQAATTAPAGGIDAEQLSLDGKFLLQVQPSVQLVTPLVSGTVDLEGYLNAWNLFQPSDKLRQVIWKKQQEQQAAAPPAPKKLPPVQPPPPSLSSVMASVARRAVIARPKTAKDVDALVASMKAIGFNQLWLDVFSGGKSHLDPAASAKDAGPDILTEALAQTKGTGIAVIPTLDLLDWGKDAPSDAVDRTMLGETSAEAKTHRQRYDSMMYSSMSEDEAAKQPPVTDLNVSPSSASVQETLVALVGRLAATPGITALALQDTVMTGYDRAPDSHYGVQGDALGYVLPLRLAFLRRQHVDPIDLAPETYDGQMNADMSLPGFDDYGMAGDAGTQWNAFRAGADRDLLQRLLVAARTSGSPRFPFWVKTRRSSYQADWYGLWEDPRSPLPELSEEFAFGGSNSHTDFAALAHAQCRTNVFVMDNWRVQSPENLAQAVKEMKPGWNGFLVDLADSPGNPLERLARSLAPPALVTPKGSPTR